MIILSFMVCFEQLAIAYEYYMIVVSKDSTGMALLAMALDMELKSCQLMYRF